MSKEKTASTTSVQSLVHTPGTWRVETGGHAKPFECIVVDRDGDCIAIVDSRGGLSTTDEIAANGRLMSRAPDMLTLIREVYDGIHRGHGVLAMASDAEISRYIEDKMCNLIGNNWR